MPTALNIVITGGSSGLGLALAQHYAREGHQIGLIARDPAKLASAIEQLKTASPQCRAEFRSADVIDPAAASAAIEQLAESMGGIDILINSAGILREGRFEDVPLASFREVMDINLFGTINISRAALAGFTESLRYEMKPQGVTVQMICPPEFDSPMVEELNTYRSPENRAHTQMVPVEPMDVIVRDTVKAIASKRYLTVTGFRAKCAALGIRYFPGVTRMIADRIIRGAQN